MASETRPYVDKDTKEIIVDDDLRRVISERVLSDPDVQRRINAYIWCDSCKHGNHEDHLAESTSADGTWTVHCSCDGKCGPWLQGWIAAANYCRSQRDMGPIDARAEK